jgi:hypothetical protein
MDRTKQVSMKYRPVVVDAVQILASRDGVRPVDVYETILMNNKELKGIIQEIQKASNEQATNKAGQVG